MHYEDEFIIATGPTDPDYDPAKAHAENLKTKIGADLYSALKAESPTLKCDGVYECDGWFRNKKRMSFPAVCYWICCPWCGGQIRRP